jgi:hypothetical protein
MNTWFSVHKNKKFLEEHDVLDKYLEVHMNTERRKGSKGIFPQQINKGKRNKILNSFLLFY